VPFDGITYYTGPRDTVHNDTINIVPITDSLITIHKNIGVTTALVSITLSLDTINSDSTRVVYSLAIDEGNVLHHIGPTKVYQLNYFRSTNKFKFDYQIYFNGANPPGAVNVKGHFFYNY